MTNTDLILLAVEASKQAYAPYSRFPVGAALECRDGRIYTACSVETAALGCALCAERAAIGKAVSDGKRSFARLAVFSPGKADYYYPCGTCLQVLSEFETETDLSDMVEILCVRGDGRYVSYRLPQLLPHPFLMRDTL